MNKRGQMTMFVIIALIIVGSIVLFYVFRERFGITKIPPEFQPVFDLYESCVEQETEAAIELAGTQAGQVFMEDYIPGSEYAPSSSHLNFLGFPVPYWYYIAGNGIIKENNVLLENGVLQKLLSLILTVLQLIVTILKAILQGFFTLFGGLIRTIGAIIGIIVLILADFQTILVLTGVYMISLGVLSKNIIKTLASVGAPIFAAISAFLSVAIGSLLGSLSAVVFSILGVLIILAIPIALVAAFLYISGYFDNGDGDGLLYIIASCLAYYLKAI